MDSIELAIADRSLRHAIRAGDTTEVKRLLGAGALPNGLPGDAPPLFDAARRGNIASIDALIAGGADVLARTASGETALHHAAHQLKPDAVACLLVNGAEVDALDDRGRTPLHWATRLAGFYPVAGNQVARLLLEVGADGEARDLVENLSVFELRPDWAVMAAAIKSAQVPPGFGSDTS